MIVSVHCCWRTLVAARSPTECEKLKRTVAFWRKDLFHELLVFAHEGPEVFIIVRRPRLVFDNATFQELLPLLQSQHFAFEVLYSLLVRLDFCLIEITSFGGLLIHTHCSKDVSIHIAPKMHITARSCIIRLKNTYFVLPRRLGSGMQMV